MSSAKQNAVRILAGAGVCTAAAYAAYVAVTWFRYGHPAKPPEDMADTYLDRLMPRYDVVERHSIRVSAPANATLCAACSISIDGSWLARAIFKGREWIMGAKAEDPVLPAGLLAATRAMGWGTLVYSPGREIVMGAVVQPWRPNPVFRALPAGRFAEFHEPEYVKVAWTLRADPVDGGAVFRSETRAIATCPRARRKFRAYWSFLSPGIALIRQAMLRQVKTKAESSVYNEVPADAAHNAGGVR